MIPAAVYARATAVASRKRQTFRVRHRSNRREPHVTVVRRGKWDILGHRTKGEKTPPAIRPWGGERGGSCERETWASRTDRGPQSHQPTRPADPPGPPGTPAPHSTACTLSSSAWFFAGGASYHRTALAHSRIGFGARGPVAPLEHKEVPTAPSVPAAFGALAIGSDVLSRVHVSNGPVSSDTGPFLVAH